MLTHYNARYAAQNRAFGLDFDSLISLLPLGEG